MEKTQFDLLILAITGLDTKFTALDAKVTGLEAKMDQGFARVDRQLIEVKKTLEMIAVQTAKTVDDVAALNKRVSKLDGPSA